ncbi:hypothetical protein C6501_15810 [Candidatus Poribacteria bacterium]|nr:MAG: hypothetical protein C6501_15810 [Candidatus Poribacteria bacterium]
MAGDFEDKTERAIFRDELAALQVELCKSSRMLANIAEVEDLTDLEEKKGLSNPRCFDADFRFTLSKTYLDISIRTAYN